VYWWHGSVIVSYALRAETAAMEGGKGGERFRLAHPGGTTISPRGTKKAVKPVKAVVSPLRAVRPALPGDRLTRREAGPKGGKGGMHRPGAIFAAFTAFPPGARG
jgi:hypothetical protein